MSASLVGSEMCIRDRSSLAAWLAQSRGGRPGAGAFSPAPGATAGCACPCLLYTSDAADDM
eukprot:13324740-Alexandrium_andersonii.AAC.1